MKDKESDRYIIRSNLLNTSMEFGNIDIPENITQSAFLITDENLYANYHEFISQFRHICIKPGEASKNPETVLDIYKQLKAENIDRQCVILGFGGGVVTDIAGFVAATYLRGVPLILIPTSLLAMADAAVGGKNGVNYAGIKNMIGTVRQPGATQIDSSFLKTLPDEHYKNGLAEVLKIAFIMDEELINELEESVNDILNRKTVVLNKLLHRACQLKIRLVEKDEQDKNIRHILNFGHSLGHAIEMEDRILHGLAVSKGMIAAMKLSMQYSGLKETEFLRLRKLLKAFDLPVEFEMKDAYWKYLMHDKKRTEGKLSFIFLESAGNAVIRKIDFQDVKKLLYAT